MLVARRVDLDTLANNIGEPNLCLLLVATFYALSDLGGSGGP